MKTPILLMTPGPVQVDDQSLLAGAQPLQHHRTKGFAALYVDCLERLKRIFKTKHHLFLTHSSGTGAMETAIANLFRPGEKVLTVETGAFGERFTLIARAFGLEGVPLKYPWGHGARVADIARMLEQHPDIKGVTVTYSETSTGVRNELEPIGKLLRGRDILFITDGVSAIGALPFDMDGWGIDCAVSASQKGFLAPPGVGMVALSKAAYAKMQKVECRGFYFDLKHYVRNQNLDIPSYPTTPAISVMFALHHSLQRLEETGMERVYDHYAKLADGLRAAVRALGLTLFTQPDALSNVLTVVNTPVGIRPAQLVRVLHDRHNVLIGGGQGEITDKVFRITTIGAIGEKEIIGTVGLLELALLDLGFLRKPGKGVTAVLERFATWGQGRAAKGGRGQPAMEASQASGHLRPADRPRGGPPTKEE